jgi:hypothetical protein
VKSSGEASTFTAFHLSLPVMIGKLKVKSIEKLKKEARKETNENAVKKLRRY